MTTFHIQRITQVTVVPVGDPLFSNQATSIAIKDDGGGEYLQVQQSTDEYGHQTISIDPEEWSCIRNTIESMILRCRDSYYPGVKEFEGFVRNFLDRIDSDGQIVRVEDGSMMWFPKENGEGLSSCALRAIADELDLRSVEYSLPLPASDKAEEEDEEEEVGSVQF